MAEWQRLGDNKSWDNIDLKQEKRGWVHLRDLRTRDFLELSPETVDGFAAYSNAVKALVEYHRAQEWDGDRNGAFCLACGSTEREGHSAGCRWVSVLAPFEEASDG